MESILPHPGDQTSEVKLSQGRAPSRGSRGGSFLPLPASGGSRRPWAYGHVPPVSASVFPGLLLCVCVSPLLCLGRTLSLDVGPPSSRGTSCGSLQELPLQRLFPIRSHREVLEVDINPQLPGLACGGGAMGLRRSLPWTVACFVVVNGLILRQSGGCGPTHREHPPLCGLGFSSGASARPPLICLIPSHQGKDRPARSEGPLPDSFSDSWLWAAQKLCQGPHPSACLSVSTYLSTFPSAWRRTEVYLLKERRENSHFMLFLIYENKRTFFQAQRPKENKCVCALSYAKSNLSNLPSKK